ncbi:uncharacterized protein LOC116990664 [Amblyraja radiata]|uniref:uncharacterized protein LOC116990664 n=1 Tax=Amblyraja radiata TaxID=386614 RepID=UPI0014034805|nr:uncharacterized protein LOC116990664 [Amblyraja radiata]
MFERLGFLIHPAKSKLIPSRIIDYLGFTIDSTNMLVTLPRGKRLELMEACSNLVDEQQSSIRRVASVIGKLVAAFSGVQFGPLHYQNLQCAKEQALKTHAGHFDRLMRLPVEAITELQWWITNVSRCSSKILVNQPSVVLQTDVSALGWGVTDTNSSCGGRWNVHEALILQVHGINYLELLGAVYGLKAYCSTMHDLHVQLQFDNTTAVAYVNHMGGIKSVSCDKLVNLIWHWCIARNIWISAIYLPGRYNMVADTRSRKFNDTEWMLNPRIFLNVIAWYGLPDIDLFASRLNHQLPKYVSWEPDPGAVAVDAFSLHWGGMFFYAFPPFCLISRCLIKIEQDSASGILVVPDWPTQPWFPLILRLIT